MEKNTTDKDDFKKKFSIKAKFSLIVVASLMVLSAIIVSIVNKTVDNFARKDEINTITTIAQGKAQEIGEWLGGTNTMLRAYAETDEIKSDNWDIIQPLLIKAYKRMNDSRYLFLAYVQEDGKGWTSKGKWLDATPLPYYAPIIKQNADYFITNPFTGATTNEPLIIIGHGVRQEGSSKNTSIMIAGIEGKSISSIAEKINIGGSGYGVIVDNNGVFVAHPDVNKVMKDNIRQLDNQGYTGMTEIGNDMIAGKENVRMFTENGQKNYMVYTPIPNSPNWTLGIIIPSAYFNRMSNSIMGRVAPITAVVILIMVLLTVFIINGISKKMEKTAAALKNIAAGEGDLTVTLDSSGTDEVSEISHYFNKTIEKIRNTLKVASDSSQSVNEVTNSLVENVQVEQETVNEIKGLIDGLHSEIDKQNAGISETDNSVQFMSDAISQLNSAISGQTNNINTSSAAIEEMIANIDSVTQILTKNQDLINEMEKRSAEVKNSIGNSVTLTSEISSESESLLEATNIIQSIAEQTNLLAMNAAIEAAHAGETGKGFAVVADEIRKLAEETGAQSSNITASLEALKTKIETIAADSEQTAQDFNKSFELTTAVKQQEKVIMDAMKEQSEGGSQIIKAVADISDSNAKVQEGSAKITNHSEKILNEMHTLTDISNTISQNITNIAEGLQEFEGSINNVSNMAGNSKTKIKTLNDEIGKFKV